MVDYNLQLSKDAFGDIIDKWTNRSTAEKFVLFGTAAILGTCWGFSKIYFWSVWRKTQQRIEEEREKLRKSKEELYQELKNDKVRKLSPVHLGNPKSNTDAPICISSSGGSKISQTGAPTTDFEAKTWQDFRRKLHEKLDREHARPLDPPMSTQVMT